jgi:hypothetical protein
MKKELPSQLPVAHTCNPSYSGDRDQQDHSQPGQIKKKPSTEKKGKNTSFEAE